MRRLALALILVCAIPLTGTVSAQSDMGTQPEIDRGKIVYDKYCSQCHGYDGDGQGYATSRVLPVPRDFTAGKYKFRTTPSGKLPTDADLIKVIKEGLPYTSMPGWPQISDTDIRNIIYYLKTLSPTWQNADSYADPINIPEPPSMTAESVEHGAQVYIDQGCGACHGLAGRGDGLSAKTLVDEWDNPLRPVDMTKRWTFRAGPTRKDIYRTFSTGVNGTPMPSYGETLAEADRWDLVDYITSLGGGDDPNYSTLLVVQRVDEELDVSDPEALFGNAPLSRFPLIGQIIEPGRNFYQSINNVDVRAVYNSQEIAFLVEWHDFTKDDSGSNDPTTEVPLWDEDNNVSSAAEEEDEGGFWGVEEEASEEDIWGADAVEDEDDFWGEGEDAGGDSADEGFSDAIGLQFPSKLPSGNRKPYFIFGDTQSSVDFWFVDLAESAVLATQYLGRGSDALDISESDEIEVTTKYDQGRWSVIFKRSLKARGGISLQEEMFVPIAFTAWDAFNRERGNKRALSPWFYFYLEPAEKISPVGPMARTAVIVLLAEILLLFFIRRRHAAAKSEAPVTGAVPDGSAS
ncbi:MAG: c-type cytochrome [Acidobacteriota bacterium]